MKIKFIETRTVEAQGEVVQTFNAGEVYELSNSSARRWLRRNAAVEVQGSVKPVDPKSNTDAAVTEAEPVKTATVSRAKSRRKYTRKPPVISDTKKSSE